jgi:hypothetical protein
MIGTGDDEESGLGDEDFAEVEELNRTAFELREAGKIEEANEVLDEVMAIRYAAERGEDRRPRADEIATEFDAKCGAAAGLLREAWVNSRYGYKGTLMRALAAIDHSEAMDAEAREAWKEGDIVAFVDVIRRSGDAVIKSGAQFPLDNFDLAPEPPSRSPTEIHAAQKIIESIYAQHPVGSPGYQSAAVQAELRKQFEFIYGTGAV